MSRNEGCAPILAYFLILVALVWSAATTDITALSILCWVIAGGSVLALIVDAAID
ncbi:hypothetical protein [Nonomuraea sp. JJY05]|uniref:hypothetical protein n=1 Tax=Nonomuraea sp. JJY05 TaxID=3350255 RepID=UPI00373ED5BF